MFGVVDQIEAIGDFARLEHGAVARGERGTELGLVAVGGLVQIDMHQHPIAQRCQQAHQRGRFLRRAVLAERTVGIDRIRIPAVNALIGPGTDARRHDQIHPAGVVRHVAIDELQCAMHTAGFIPMHAAGDQHGGQSIVPLAALDRE